MHFRTFAYVHIKGIMTRHARLSACLLSPTIQPIRTKFGGMIPYHPGTARNTPPHLAINAADSIAHGARFLLSTSYLFAYQVLLSRGSSAKTHDTHRNRDTRRHLFEQIFTNTVQKNGKSIGTSKSILCDNISS